MADANKAFWEGVRAGKLLIQKGAGCGLLRQPARPMCPQCHSLEWEMVESTGRGTVYSRIIPRHMVPEGQEKVVVLVDMDEGGRFYGNVLDADPRSVEIGMAVQVCFEDRDGGIRLPQFQLVESGA